MGKLKTVGVHFYRENSRYACDDHFSSTKVYQYVTYEEAKVGDYALVLGAGRELCITKVCKVFDGLMDSAKKPVVAIIDMVGYEEKLAKILELRTAQEAVDARVEAVKKARKYEDVLADDEEGQKLLDTLRKLEEGI